MNGNFEYSIKENIVIVSENQELFRIPISEFREKAKQLLVKIKSNSGTFSVPEIEQFMQSINCLSLKASSSAKTDITIVVHDQRTGLQPTLGFSIKSQLGNPSTLLNAGETTNFIFRIENKAFSRQEMEQINSLFVKRGQKLSKDIRGRIGEIIFVQQLKVFVGLVFKHCQKLIYISVFCLGKGFHNEFERLMNQLTSFYCIV